MLRYEDINEISDGRLYASNDMAPVGTYGCKGCSHCCKSDMGVSIVLGPYDIYNMCTATGKSFDELLVGMYVEISMIDGLALPHMKMDKGCRFLVNDRCSIHEKRPDICRLFPLGRIYSDKGFDYFLQISECPVPDKEDVLVSDWIGIPDSGQYDSYILKWHRFLKFVRNRIAEINEMNSYEIERLTHLEEKNLRDYFHILGDEELESHENIEAARKEKLEMLREECSESVKEAMKLCLRRFYMESYNSNQDFYTQFSERMKNCLSELRKIH